MKKGLLVIVLLWIVVGFEPLWSQTTNPPVLPCWDNPNVLCRGTPYEPKVVGKVTALEGNPIDVCIYVFDCNTGEELRADGHHEVRKITIPQDANFTGIHEIDCNLVWDVNSVIECEGPEGESCSVLYFQWANTLGYVGHWRATAEVIDNDGDRGYVALDIHIRRRNPPDFLLGVGDCP